MFIKCKCCGHINEVSIYTLVCERCYKPIERDF